MGSSICRFMPAKDYTDSIKTVNFVYEAELKKLRQPFFKPVYLINLVTRGSGKLILNGEAHQLEKGAIFFNFPAEFFEIKASDDFEFIYISFTADSADKLLEGLGITRENTVFFGFSHITEFWLSSLRRLDEFNANILTESVLLYTLSFFGKKGTDASHSDKDNLFSGVLDYIDKHFSDSEINLKNVAGIFAYSQKYFSQLFKRNVGIGFCEYINDKRMKHAISLIDEGHIGVSEISELCGFSDPLYFSKVFKKYTGKSPREYIYSKQ